MLSCILEAPEADSDFPAVREALDKGAGAAGKLWIGQDRIFVSVENEPGDGLAQEVVELLAAEGELCFRAVIEAEQESL